MMPKSYKWDRFKTLLYKNSFPKENGEIGACIDSDFISEFVKISFLAYEEEIFNIKSKTNDYVLFIKHMLNEIKAMQEKYERDICLLHARIDRLVILSFIFIYLTHLNMEFING